MHIHVSYNYYLWTFLYDFSPGLLLRKGLWHVFPYCQFPSTSSKTATLFHFYSNTICILLAGHWSSFICIHLYLCCCFTWILGRLWYFSYSLKTHHKCTIQWLPLIFTNITTIFEFFTCWFLFLHFFYWILLPISPVLQLMKTPSLSHTMGGR